ncbi:hypothetical protein M8C17_21055 [Micromonospora sp. RHAY321]|uniref:hypothetical protein n=1 Tax=Micromonospora sp. RHAY321 TaxID=2944807 RepID=UPI00207D307E|nr:hypothetical protein [Micromonospora sp. RHAY321]MCO1597644.1 hypothetical protein [Micromonospora sp. RHAY321]
MRRWTAVLTLTVLLAGCGTGEQVDPQAPAPVWQSAAPTTPAALTAAEAKSRYLAIVAPYNTALEELEDAVNAGKPWRTVRTLAADVARTNAAHAVGLSETVWPAAVLAPMGALLKENDVALRHWRRAGEAADADALMREIRAAAARSGAKEAGRVRAALGLPGYREG